MSGPFQFSTKVAAGSTYQVTIGTEPTDAAVHCTVENGTGNGIVASTEVTTVNVVCRPIGGFAYVPAADETISAYQIDPATGSLTTVTGSPLPFTPAAVPVADPTGKFLYALPDSGQQAHNIHGYVVDRSTGALSEMPDSPFVANFFVSSIAMAAKTSVLYAATVSPTIYAYNIAGSTGTLTNQPGSPYLADPMFQGGLVAIDPLGRFLYMAVQTTAGGIYAFNINQTTGVLTEAAGNPVPTGPMAFAVTVDPRGKFLYATNPGFVLAFSINATDGTLAPVPGSPFPAGSSGAGPYSLNCDPSGTFLYVGIVSGLTDRPDLNTVSGFRIDADTGALTPIPGSPFATGQSSTGVTTDPSGKYLYVASSLNSTVSAFSIDANSGALTGVAEPFPTGANPQGVLVIN